MEIKYLLQKRNTEYVMPFNRNVLRVALNMEEELIACIIAARYTIIIDKKMVEKAIKANMMEFLYMIYGYNKNFY